MNKKITSIEEFIKEIKSINNSWLIDGATTKPWYRGQANSSWKLVPSIYRSNLKKYERELLRDFKLNCIQYLPSRPSSDFEWMFIMQHHTLPTRLLDWTESSLIALYFAVKDFQSIETDSCVWVMHPWDLNIISLNEKTVPITGYNKLNNYLLSNPYSISSIHSLINDQSRNIKAKFPAAIRPVKNNQRIIAQKGMFTIHGKKSDDIESVFKININSKIKKITINKSSNKVILKDLIDLGISHSVLFPELDGISTELKLKYSIK